MPKEVQNYAKHKINAQKFANYYLKVCPSGDISPNLVTLDFTPLFFKPWTNPGLCLIYFRLFKQILQPLSTLAALPNSKAEPVRTSNTRTKFKAPDQCDQIG